MQIPIFDIYDYSYIPLWHRPWFIILSALSLLGLFVALIVMLIRFMRYKKRMKVKKSWEIALEELSMLYVHQMNSKDFYCALTTIMKMYLCNHYECALTGKTDQEILIFIDTLALAPEIAAMVRPVFQDPIMVKFANQQVQQEQMVHDLQRCKTFIVHTRIESKGLDRAGTLKME